MSKNDTHKVVIVGGGFCGLACAKALRKARDVEVTLIDRRNFHLFQPLLYQVATGGLSPANIAAPLRAVLSSQKNVRVVMGNVNSIDAEGKTIGLADGDTFDFDSLVVATGARHSYFGNDQWEPHAPGLKTIEEATEIRRRLLTAFEDAEHCDDEEQRRQNMTFVVIGAGPTGVELAGAIAELSQHTLRGNFKNIDTRDAKVLLLEAADRVLPPYSESLSAKAEQQLEQLGVTVKTGAIVTAIDSAGVTFKLNNTEETIDTNTVLWAAGVRASSLGARIADATGAETDKAGRIKVNADCSIAEHPNIFVAGDLSHYQHNTDQPLPGVAPVATAQGRYIAKAIRAKLDGRVPGEFKYHDKGSMATIGRASAVVESGKIKFSGFFAWLAWLFVHLFFLIDFQNRILVLMQWCWNYITRNRAARLITGINNAPWKRE